MDMCVYCVLNWLSQFFSPTPRILSPLCRLQGNQGRRTCTQKKLLRQGTSVLIHQRQSSSSSMDPHCLLDRRPPYQLGLLHTVWSRQSWYFWTLPTWICTPPRWSQWPAPPAKCLKLVHWTWQHPNQRWTLHDRQKWHWPDLVQVREGR